jgi:dihydrofolate reductase
VQQPAGNETPDNEFAMGLNKASKTFNLILTMGVDRGISFRGAIPWSLNGERKHFARMTKTTVDAKKRNVVIMGRNTFADMPDLKRGPFNHGYMYQRLDVPLSFPMRHTVVLTLNTEDRTKYPSDVKLYSELQFALTALEEQPMADQIEKIWVVGGASLFRRALLSQDCHRIYVTEILDPFKCDLFLPEFNKNEFKLVPNDDDIPECIQEENGVRFRFLVYERYRMPYD